MQGQKYYYRAFAHNSAGWDYSSVEESFTTKPEGPTGLAISGATISSLDLDWAIGAEANRTVVVRKIGSYPTNVTDGAVAYNDTSNSFTDTPLVSYTHYYYRLWSWVGGSNIYSDNYTSENDWTLAGTPTVASTVPATGNRGESSKIVGIVGTSFANATSVAYSGVGITVNGFSITNDTYISSDITIAWDASLGARDVGVTSPSGTGTGIGVFTVGAPVSTVNYTSPSTGNRGESNKLVAINGTGLIGATLVSFGSGISVNSFTVSNSTNISSNITIAWDATLGNRDVVVTTPGGEGTGVNNFTVSAPLPTVSSIVPNTGALGETGKSVIIAGTGFIGTTVVFFNSTGVAVDNFTVVSGIRLDANITISGLAVLGARNVTVTSPGGNGTLVAGFTVVLQAPIVSSTSPDSAEQSIGNVAINVTISGNYFSGATSVSFGSGITVISYTVNNSTHITASIKAAWNATVGYRNVVVTTASGPGVGDNVFSVAQGIIGYQVSGVYNSTTANLKLLTRMYLTVTGNGTVISSLLTENARGTTIYHDAVEYFDLYVTNSTYSEMKMRLYYTGSWVKDPVARWWNGSRWELCSDQEVNVGDSYVEITITNSTTPNLSDFVGTPLLVGGDTDMNSTIRTLSRILPLIFAAIVILTLLVMVGPDVSIILAAIVAVLGAILIGIISAMVSNL
jgi:hypothetical protein